MIQIFGKGGFAREVGATYEWANQEKIVYLENEEIKNASTGKDAYTVIAIGDVSVRKRLAQENPDVNYCILIYGGIYPVDSLKLDHNYFTKYNSIGKGTIICPGTILTVNSIIGEHVIINLNCTIGHDCKIGNYVTISPGANISGNVEIGDECYIGTNAVIREKIKICSGVTIGAGAVVVKDITEPGTYVGNPVKKL
jgi:sugar O-acyltransferase (sialic acid O-acetyltransferase NeuD family)